MKKFNHLNVPQHWEHYWSKYPEGYTILEALLNWVNQVDGMVDNVNDWNKYLDNFVETFDEKLRPHVREFLEDMVKDGTMADIINEDVFGELNRKIEDVFSVNVKNFGIISDGTTDQTEKLIALFKDTMPDMRGDILIPYNVKFNMREVYPHIPVGAVVYDRSMINMYNSDTYKQKVVSLASSDLVNDDTILQVLSDHHPAILLNNTGGSNSVSAERNAASIMFGHGFNDDGTAKTSIIQQVYHLLDQWHMTYRILHKYDDPETTVDSTIFAVSEDGKLALNALATDSNLQVDNSRTMREKITKASFRNHTEGSQTILELIAKDIDGSDQRSTIRQLGTGVLGIFSSTGQALQYFHKDGVEMRSAQKLRLTKLTGAIPDVSEGYSFVVDNPAPIDMTHMYGLDAQEVLIQFANSNTTLKQGYFRMKSGQDETPAQGEAKRFIKNNGISEAWFEV